MTITLTTFVPGTKAKADEVNANFSTLRDAINEKASMDGDNIQTFAVADGTQNTHAVNKGQLNDLSDELIAKINKTGTKFCVKSGNLTAGKGDLFHYNLLDVTPLIGGTYGNLIIVDYEGTQTTITSANSLSLTGISNGEYNIFINKDGELYILNNTIYRQPSRPTMVVNDVWLNTGVEPFKCVKYAGASDVNFFDVPLGKVIVNNNAIIAIETFAFNQNGYNITSQSTIQSKTPLSASVSHLPMPNYANGTDQSWSTVYQAPTDGYLYIWSAFGSSLSVSTDNSTWKTVQSSWFSDQGYSASAFLPIPKGIYYKAIYNSANGGKSLVFYTCLGV